MTRILFFVAVTCVVSMPAALHAQPPKVPGPVKEHQWLQKFVGSWETHSEATTGPEQPPLQCEGTMTSRMLGGFWIISDVKGDLMGTTMTAVQTLGYDPAKKKYVGTWVDSMINHLWTYEGTVDKSGKKLSLLANGPNFMTAGKVTKFRDDYEFKSADEIVLTSWMQSEDGKWVKFMAGTMRRKK